MEIYRSLALEDIWTIKLLSNDSITTAFGVGEDFITSFNI
jgi:hypothetical protein